MNKYIVFMLSLIVLPEALLTKEQSIKTQKTDTIKKTTNKTTSRTKSSKNKSKTIKLNHKLAAPQNSEELKHATLTEDLQKGATGLINMIHTTQFVSLLITKTAKDGTASDEALRRLIDFKGWGDSLLNEQAHFLHIKDLGQLQLLATQVLYCAKALYNYLDDIIASGLMEFKEFKGEQIFKKIMDSKKTLSLKELSREFAVLEKKTFALQTRAEKATLTWYNVAARNIEHYILNPIHKYDLKTVGTIGGAGLLFVMYTLWNITADHYRGKWEAAQEAKRNDGDKTPDDKIFSVGETCLKDLDANMLKNQVNQLLMQPNTQGQVPHITNKAELDAFINRMINQNDNDKNTIAQPGDSLALGHNKRLQQIKAQFDKEQEVARQKFMEENIPTVLRKLFETIGWPLITNPQTGIIDHTELQKNPHLYGWFSHFNNYLQNVMMRNNPVTTFVGGYAIKSLYEFYFGDAEKTGKVGLTEWIGKKRTQLWNQLRGGAYSEQANPFEFVPKARFADFIGMDEVKKEFEVLIEFVLNSEMFINTNKIPERGYLLTGPTRTGKSFFIETLFGEILYRALMRGKETQMKFKKIYSYQLRNGSSIEIILMLAKLNAPIMLWFDEIDLLSLQRGIGDGKNLQDFLTGMGNSFDNDPQRLVILLATTNRPENIDLAMKQPGRFGKEVRFEYPAARYRRQYIIGELAKMAIDPNRFDIETLVEKTAGQSFEGLRALIKGATIASWLRKVPFTQELLEEIIDIELRHIIMLDRKELPESEKHLLATFMAAKALVHYLLSHGAERLDKVTIKAVMVSLKDEHVWETYMKDNQKENDEKKIQYGGLFTKHLYDTANIKTYQEIIIELKVLLAGFVAEGLFLGGSTFKFHEADSIKAFQIIEQLVLQGVDKKLLSQAQMGVFTLEIFEMRKKLMSEIEVLLNEYKPLLDEMVSFLKERSTMTVQDLEELFDQFDKGASNTSEDIESKEAIIDEIVKPITAVEIAQEAA